MNKQTTTQSNRRSPRLWALALVAGSALLLSGCGDSFNNAQNRQAVVAKYGTEVTPLPDRDYRFIARKPDGSVWYIETLKTKESGYISAELQIFAAK